VLIPRLLKPVKMGRDSVDALLAQSQSTYDLKWSVFPNLSKRRVIGLLPTNQGCRVSRQSKDQTLATRPIRDHDSLPSLTTSFTDSHLEGIRTSEYSGFHWSLPPRTTCSSFLAPSLINMRSVSIVNWMWAIYRWRPCISLRIESGLYGCFPVAY
jgi:hypothetical protein